MTVETPVYVLDACALIAYLNDEEGAALVEERLTEAARGEVSVLLAAVSLCEVYYDCLRTKGGVELLQRILRRAGVDRDEWFD